MQEAYAASKAAFSKSCFGTGGFGGGLKGDRRQKKGGDNQIGHHLPGWGGVLLGKLNLQLLIVPFDT
jgi:hypothetical protein